MCISSVVLSKAKLRNLIPHTEGEGFSIDEIMWLLLAVMLSVFGVTFVILVGMSLLSSS